MQISVWNGLNWNWNWTELGNIVLQCPVKILQLWRSDRDTCFQYIAVFNVFQCRWCNIDSDENQTYWYLYCALNLLVWKLCLFDSNVCACPSCLLVLKLCVFPVCLLVRQQLMWVFLIFRQCTSLCAWLWHLCVCLDMECFISLPRA